MKATVIQDEAFGIVPVLPANSGDRFLLIQHISGHWGFPKGHAEPGESPLETATREFVEETGIRDFQILGETTFLEQYTFVQKGRTVNKTVVYFTALVQSETVECQVAEIRAYAWATFEDAIARLTFQGSQQILRNVHQYLATYSNR